MYILINEINEMIREHGIKTFDKWQGSSKSMPDYLSIGDIVDQTFADYFLNVLPPIIMERTLIMMGGAFGSCPETGHNTYLAVKMNSGGQWIYIGEHTRKSAYNHKF